TNAITGTVQFEGLAFQTGDLVATVDGNAVSGTVTVDLGDLGLDLTFLRRGGRHFSATPNFDAPTHGGTATGTFHFDFDVFGLEVELFHTGTFTVQRQGNNS